MLKHLCLAVAAAIALAAPASAATQTFDVTFSATGFVPTPVPFAEPFTGSFTITHDFSLDALNQQTGLTNVTASQPLLSPSGFDYDASLDRLRVGGIISAADGVFFLSGGMNDFLIEITDLLTATPVFDAGNSTNYAPTGVGLSYGALSVTGTVTAAEAAVVPVPSTLLAAIGGPGIAARRRALARG